jgi:hypothetical protein
MKAAQIMSIMSEVCGRKGAVVWDDIANAIESALAQEAKDARIKVLKNGCQRLGELNDRMISIATQEIDRLQSENKAFREALLGLVASDNHVPNSKLHPTMVKAKAVLSQFPEEKP